ncbi:hypothetical protein PMSD_06180 [Paenibacillus macquariensis subsp. defensor]|nr:hypothetical protein PMSD_06180 [Paenibacillus macquariensis subsp. defensor]
MKYLLTLDVGTTAVKAALFDEHLKPCALVIQEYTLLTPQTDWVELPAEIYWDTAVLCIQQVMAESGVPRDEIAAITCTTQGETLIPITQDGQVLHNAIVWMDARAKVEALTVGGQCTKERFYHKTGVPEASPYTPLCKLIWLKNNLPDVYLHTHKLLLVEDYLVYRLSGRFVTNPAVLCSSGYFDVLQNDLWHEILERNGLDADKIPGVLPCGSVVAPLCQAAALELGLDTSTFVTTGAMDQVAAAVGIGNISPGTVNESTGTCLCVAATVQDPHLDSWSSVAVYSHALPGRYLKVVVTQTAGMILKWFRDEFCVDLLGKGDFARMDELAKVEPAGSRNLMLFPYLTGMESDPAARGVFFGFGLDTSRGCFIRAVMESVGYTLKQNLAQMGLAPECLYSLGGGARSAVWNQIKANICNTEIRVSETSESASLGAAMLGGVACGIFSDLDDACLKLHEGDVFSPQLELVARYKDGYGRFNAMYEYFKPLFVEG